MAHPSVFVDFVTAESCSRALAVDPSPLGPCVEAQFAIKRGAKAAVKSAAPGPDLEVADPRSVVVTSTSAKIRKELFQKYCARFGEVESVKVTHKSDESRAFVRFTEEKFAKACVSQRDGVIDDDILIFIRPAAEANEPLHWNSNAMTRLNSFFKSELDDGDMCEDLFNLVMKRKADQDARKAEQQDEEEYQPGDADASRRCRRLFVTLQSDIEGGSGGSEADDEALNFEEHEQVEDLDECLRKCQLQSEEKNEEEWPSCDSIEGQRIQSLVCSVPQASEAVQCARPSQGLRSREECSSGSSLASSPDFSEVKEYFLRLSQIRPHLSSLMTNSSSSGSDFVPSPPTPATNQDRLISAPGTNQDRFSSPPRIEPIGLFRSRGRGLNAIAGIPAAPGSVNPTPLALGRGQRTVTQLGGLGRGRRS